MNFALKPNTIISHFLPGAFFLLAAVGIFMLGNTTSVAKVCNLSGPMVALLGGIGFPVALIVGLIFDAIRNSIVESIWDRYDKMEWDIFAHGDEKFRENLMDSYYGYYVFDVNLMIAIVAIIVAIIGLLVMSYAEIKYGVWILAASVLIALVLFCDSRDLRKEINRLAKEGMSKKAEGENAEQHAT